MREMSFSEKVLQWYTHSGRNNLPWHTDRNPYRVWISEIMLQQTQVQTVIPYFNRFMGAFPTLECLAHAPDDTIMSYFAGLGYYSRARNMIKTARMVFFNYHNIWPDTLPGLEALPGIGRSTAAAILSQAFHKPAAILDANVIRVFSRYFMIPGYKEDAATKKILWKKAEECLPPSRFADYTQAIMDLGALCCTQKVPSCNRCPLQETCLACQHQATTLYPEKRPKPVRPEKNRYFFLFYNENHELFLFKNNPTGIWGGLWVLPSIEKENDIVSWLNTIHVSYSDLATLPVRKHTFTHFHLYLHPVMVRVKASVSPMLASRCSPDYGWFAHDTLYTLGIPAPVSRLIQAAHPAADIAHTG